MKIRVTATIIGFIVLVASLCIADSGSKSSDSDTLAALRKELQQTQAQLEQVIARTSALEQQVRALEQSNAELQREVQRLQVPREPRWGRPQTNQVPHLTPLQTN